MRFGIDAKTRGGLRVIPTIPNITRCWLEGRNGIGKTVAVRLLELVAGKQPYADDTSGWMALKENLGPTTISIDEFPGTASIQSIGIELTPDQWPNHPSILTNELGRVFIDGNLSNYQTLRKYIDITRISGDETVVSHLRTLVGVHHGLTVRGQTWLEETAQEADGILTPIVIDFQKLSKSQFESTTDAVRIAEKHFTTSSSQFDLISRRRRDLETLIELSDIKKEQELLGPRVQAALEESNLNVRRLTAQKDQLADQLRLLVPEHAVSQQLQKELEALQQLRDGRLERAARTHSTAQQALQTVHLNGQTIAAARRATHQERRDLLAERASLASLPDVLEIIEATRAPLAEIEASSLDTEIVAIVEGTQRVTASALRLGFDARTEELKGHAAYEALSGIDGRVQDKNKYLRRLDSLAALESDARRKAALLAKVEGQIDIKTKQLRASTGNEYSGLLDGLQKIESELTSAIKREAEYRVHLDLLNRSGGAQELDLKIGELAQCLDISPEQASGQLDDVVQRQQEMDSELQQSRSTLTGARNAHKTLTYELERLLRLLARGADYEWLRNSVPTGYLPTMSTDQRDAIRQLTCLAEAARSVQLKIEASLDQLAAIQQALEHITRSIAMHREPPRIPYIENMTKWYEAQMALYLSNDNIRETIFDGGEFLRFDLMNGFVIWRTESGEQRRRPIEAFSSGERAFAYMLAAILGHSKSDAEYRVFFLDEFGAYIEDRRRDRLWHFLDERLLRVGIASQVVLILPTQPHSGDHLETNRFVGDGYFAVEAQL